MGAGILQIYRAFAAQPAAGVLYIRIFFLQQLLVSGPGNPVLIAEIAGLEGGRNVEPAQIRRVPASFFQLVCFAFCCLNNSITDGGMRTVRPLLFFVEASLY